MSILSASARPAYHLAVEDETRLGSTSSGWLSSSGSIDHGRFPPGTTLDSRYRIIGLLGRGGMGEVYRADDLRLGQQVALKLLPESLAHDAVRLAQFHNEVRTARHVSHPNVCRVYDIGEIRPPGSGQPLLFITMEYVDGEDLSSLLRRIGRLPEDKALEIARQLCAGLAAAHERGVLHRDLKPANVMLDGAGKVRIMDFSLAAIGAVTDIRAGTPAYMAPEQLDGREVTVRSDIYALGLVLYELFTGRRAFDAKTLAELVAQHASGTITAPAEIVKSLDESTERAIMRCLDPEPARRPSSALAVAASLPGGDPLAAALAAGETPSPEMIAAVGGESATLSPVAGMIWLAVAALLALTIASLGDRTSLLTHVPFTKPAAVLLDRADEIRRSLGYTDTPVDEMWEFTYNTDYLNWGKDHGVADDHWRALAGAQPAAMLFRRRTSPVALVPFNRLSLTTENDPPLVVAGSTLMHLDTRGRLTSFVAIPPESETTPAASPAATDWRPLFSAAALDMSAFTEVAPSRTPATYADERRAWRGVFPGTQIPITLQAAGYRGRVVDFEITGAWTKGAREPEAGGGDREFGQTIVILSLLGLAAVFARRNLRSGRADRRGGFRLGAVLTGTLVMSWVLLPHVDHLGDDVDRLFAFAGIGLFIGGIMLLIYLAIEPFVRKSWPTMLVGWSRALAGRIRDAVVGRDLLIGVVAGLLLLALDQANALLPGLRGRPDPIPMMPNTGFLEHPRFVVLAITTTLNGGMQNALLSVLIFTLFRELLKRMTSRLKSPWLASDYAAAGFALVIMTLIQVMNTDPASRDLAAVAYLVLASVVFLFVLLRYGLLAVVVMYTIYAMVKSEPLTLRSASLYAGPAWVLLGAVLVFAVIGLRFARGDEPLFGRPAPDSGR
jgi:serine/threonine-protein kinase